MLNRDELIIFHRLLTQRLIGLKQLETKHGYVTQIQLQQAVEIARLQKKIKRGLAGEMDVEAEAEQKLRVMLVEGQVP